MLLVLDSLSLIIKNKLTTARTFMNMQQTISQFYDKFSPGMTIPEQVCAAVHECITMLGKGQIRVCDDQHQVNQWVKQAVLLAFALKQNQLTTSGFTKYFDKVENKFSNYDADQFMQEQLRVVPGAIVREGAYIGPNTVLMPCFVNIGAYVGSGTMVDTWATVGACAQVGKNVHLSGGAGIGGVLEPLQSQPTIIEDNCFIGARSEIVEGVIVRKNSVISMGVYIGQSTKIYNRATQTISYGEVPPGSVVVPGSIPSSDGQYSLNAAIIVKQIDERTKQKVKLTELLRT